MVSGLEIQSEIETDRKSVMYVLQWVQDRAEQVKVIISRFQIMLTFNLSSAETYIMSSFREVP
jgi:hypothetical protein